MGGRWLTGRMDSHTTNSFAGRMEIVEAGRRRRWTIEEKVRIVEESLRGDWPVSAVARHHALSPSQLFTWRKVYREGRLAPEGATTDATAGFIPAVIAREPRAGMEAAEEGGEPGFLLGSQGRGRMEIVLSGGRRVMVGPDVDTAALARVLRVLEG